MAVASLTSLASSLALVLLSAAGLVVVVRVGVVVGAAVPAPAAGAAPALRPSTLTTCVAGGLALGDPVADQQADDYRHQQHREQPEQARVAAQPPGEPEEGSITAG